MADKNELAQPRNIEEAIRNKVREVVFGAIPDDKIDELVENERKKFFEEPTRRYDQVSRKWENTGPTLFEQLIHDILKEELTPKLKLMVQQGLKGGVGWIDCDVDGNPIIKNDVLADVIIEKMGNQLIEMFLHKIINDTLSQLQKSNY